MFAVGNGRYKRDRMKFNWIILMSKDSVCHRVASPRCVVLTTAYLLHAKYPVHRGDRVVEPSGYVYDRQGVVHMRPRNCRHVSDEVGRLIILY